MRHITKTAQGFIYLHALFVSIHVSMTGRNWLSLFIFTNRRLSEKLCYIISFSLRSSECFSFHAHKSFFTNKKTFFFLLFFQVFPILRNNVLRSMENSISNYFVFLIETWQNIFFFLKYSYTGQIRYLGRIVCSRNFLNLNCIWNDFQCSYGWIIYFFKIMIFLSKFVQFFSA